MHKNIRFGVSASSVARAISTGFLLWAGAATVASAQQEAASNSGDIVVTATRRAADVQEIAVSVTPITEAQIQSLAPSNLQSFSGLAPNLFVGTNTLNPGLGGIYIRGLGQSDPEKAQTPPVGVVVDGVFYGTSTGQIVDAFDIRQVEVSRGPQGIFFGRNTTGGVVAINRSLPTHQWGFKGSVSYGTANDQAYRAVANAPIGETAGLKLGLTYRDRDGYVTNVYQNKKVGGKEYTAGLIAFDWDATSWLNVLLSADISRYDGEATPIQFGGIARAKLAAAGVGGNPATLYGPQYNPITGSPNGLGVRQVSNDLVERDSYDLDTYSLTLNADTPLGKLTSQTAYMKAKDFTLQDVDGTCRGAVGCTDVITNAGLGPRNHVTRASDYDQFSEELRLSGSLNNIDYLVGAYYFEHNIDFYQLTETFQGNVIGAGLRVDQQLVTEELTSLSFFGNLDWHITPTVTLSAGVRTIDETKDFTTAQNRSLSGAPYFVTLPKIAASKDWDDTITRFGVSWQASDQTMLYATRSTGFRSGGFSHRGTLSEQLAGNANCGVVGGCPSNNFLAYNPETVTAYEVGAKNSYLDGNFVFNVAAFQNEIQDFQIQRIAVTPGGPLATNTYILTLPEVEVKGVEIEATLKPVIWSPALEGLTLTANVGIQKGEITNGVVDRRLTGGAPGTTDLTASTPLIRLPEYSYTLRGAYEREVGPGNLQLSLSYTYLDDFVWATGAGATDTESGYGLTNAQIGYEWGNYRLSVNGQNIGDVDYRDSSTPAAYFQFWGAPATYSVELQAKF